MFRKASPILLLCVIVVASGNSLQGTIDVTKIEAILRDNLKSKDVTSFYYAIKGLSQLNVKIPNVCEQFKTLTYDAQNIEHIFQLANAAALTSCQNSLKPEVAKLATQTLDKKDATISEIYHAVYTLKALGKGTVYDKEDGLKNLIQLLKKDDSPANYAYVFTLCEHMGCQAWTAAHAEGALLAADETDSRALSFEGGLPVTAAMLATIHRSHTTLKKPSPLSAGARLKFGAWLLTRRGASSARGAALLLEAATAIADDTPTPIAIAIKGKKHITADSDSIDISVTDILGRPLRGLKPDEVVAQSATRLSDDVVVLSKQPLTPASDGATYTLNLAKIKTAYGVYKVAVSAGGAAAHVAVAVLGAARVAAAEVALGDADGTTSPRLTTVLHPGRLPEVLHADHMQKLSIKFTVTDGAGRAVEVQQAFVHVAAVAGAAGGVGRAETVLVAEPDSNKVYKVEMNVGAMSKLLPASGEYEVTLFVGDAAAAAPLAWPLGTVALSFPAPPARAAAPARAALPEIAHQFRAAEPRPPRGVSDVFAAAAAAPLPLLLLLWARLGVNLRGLDVSPSALLFHLGLGASLCLYGLLWLQLTMFETARLLAPLAALTFLAGHRLLRRLASKR